MQFKRTQHLAAVLLLGAGLSNCAPSISTPITLSYEGSSGVAALNQWMQINPTQMSVGNTRNSVSNCGLQPGSPNASLFPSSLSINSTTCSITGTPTGFLSPTVFTIGMTDNKGASTTGNVAIVVGNWAESTTAGSADSQFEAVAADSSSNTYAVGYINGNSTFGFGNGVTATGGYNGGINAVVVKYNSAGVAQWAQPVVGGTSTSLFSAVDVDSSGNVYVAGYINGTSTFGFGNGITATGFYSGQNLLVVKYNSSGAAQWANTTTTSAPPGASYNSGVAVDSSGNIYTAGSSYGSGTFNFGNSISATSTRSVYNGTLIQYSAAGVPQWAQMVIPAANFPSYFSGIALDSSGNPYVSGYVNSNNWYTFGPGVFIDGEGSGSDPWQSGFVAKYNTSGTALWATSTGATADITRFSGVAVDSSGNAYVTGLVGSTGTYNFGNGVTANPVYNGTNGVLLKYSSSGTPLWAVVPTVASGASYFSSVAVDSAGNVYPAGYINQNTQYGFGNGVGVSGAYSGGINSVVLKYDSTGTAQWAFSTFQAFNTSYFAGVTTDPSGNVYGVGNFLGSQSFEFGAGVFVSGYYAGASGNALIVKY